MEKHVIQKLRNNSRQKAKAEDLNNMLKKVEARVVGARELLNMPQPSYTSQLAFMNVKGDSFECVHIGDPDDEDFPEELMFDFVLATPDPNTLPELDGF